MRRWCRAVAVSAAVALPLCGAGRPLAALDRPVTQPAAGAANTLTEAEAAAGWALLFDGKTTTGWRGFKKEKCPDGWQVVDGTLDRVKGGGDLITVGVYDSFELVLDYRISPAGNSGVMYHVTEDADRPAFSGPECQIEDNADAHDPELSGWCYALYRPAIDPKTGKPLDTTNPTGQWNTLRILIDGPHVEHWMNGVKYVEYELWSKDWDAGGQDKVYKMAEVRHCEVGAYLPAGPWRGSRVPEHQDPAAHQEMTPRHDPSAGFARSGPLIRPRASSQIFDLRRRA